MQFLPLATRVLLLDKEGNVVGFAPWEELKARVPDWRAYVGDMVETAEAEAEATNEEEAIVVAANGNGNAAAPPPPVPVPNPLHRPPPTLTTGRGMRVRPPDDRSTEEEGEGEQGLGQEGGPYIVKEEREQGGVAGATYRHYLRSGGVGRGAVVVALLVLAQGALTTADFWLKVWATSSGSKQRRILYPCVYAGLIGAVVVLGFGR